MKREWRVHLALILCFATVTSQLQIPVLASEIKPKVGSDTKRSSKVLHGNRVGSLPNQAGRLAPASMLSGGIKVHPLSTTKHVGHSRPSQSGQGKPEFASIPGQSSTLMPDGRVLLLGGQR